MANYGSTHTLQRHTFVVQQRVINKKDIGYSVAIYKSINMQKKVNGYN